ncbi:MAG: peptide chain release factor N(5)-glutamine methyltransferase [Desulfobulbaceae bacterium]|nr:peptide chain release factor N(5)-glutamine methyltransferase [Desulfobulbaceae bacterium]
MEFAQLYKQTVVRLRQAGIENGHADAAQLFEFCFGLNRSRLVLDGAAKIPGRDLVRFHEILERRLSREPLHYIIGSREFWSLDFIVSPAVLVPRPETEFVIDTVLAVLKKNGFHHGAVLDMCTGSGVIAVVLARELEASQVIAVDSSADALHIAAQNFHRLAREHAIFPVCSDLFTGMRQAAQFELIVANPPYIDEADIAGLEPEVREWEPRAALTGGAEGLEVIRQLADQAYRYLLPGGWLFIEIGSDQGEKVQRLFAEHVADEYEHVAVLPDWSGRQRLLQARRKGKKEWIR